MYDSVNIKVKGVAPLLLHNGQGADPLNPINKLVKPISKKRNKTEEDHEVLAQLEWVKSFYPSESGTIQIVNNRVVITGFGFPVIPGELIESALIEGAKKIRRGTDFKPAIMSAGNWRLLYNGPSLISEMLDNPNFRDTRMVTIDNKKIPRCRPKFNEWALSFTVEFLSDLLNRQDIIDVMEITGRRCGFGDYRPQYGRFMVESIS